MASSVDYCCPSSTKFDSLLHTVVIKSVSEFLLLSSQLKSVGPFPLTSAFAFLDIFPLKCENPRSAVSEILKPDNDAPFKVTQAAFLSNSN